MRNGRSSVVDRLFPRASLISVTRHCCTSVPKVLGTRLLTFCSTFSPLLFSCHLHQDYVRLSVQLHNQIHGAEGVPRALQMDALNSAYASGYVEGAFRLSTAGADVYTFNTHTNYGGENVGVQVHSRVGNKFIIGGPCLLTS